MIADIIVPNSKILIVGEAPGEEEEAEGIPFVGKSGKFLRLMLREAGIDPALCSITNVMQTRPPNNDFAFFYEDKQPSNALVEARQRLNEKVRQIRPNVVLALGNEALIALTGKHGITNWRGTTIQTPNSKVLATYHPAAVLRQYSWKPIVELDLQKLLRESRTSQSLEPRVNFIIEPSFRDVCDFLSKPMKTLSVDIETYNVEGRWLIRSVGLAYDEHNAISIPFTKNTNRQVSTCQSSTIIKLPSMSQQSETFGSYWTVQEEVSVIEMLSKTFADDRIEKIGHNIVSFDLPVIEDYFHLEIKNIRLDTMHAFHCCYLELPKGLDFVSSITTDFPNYWTELNNADDRQVWKYNCYDCVATLEASKKIEADLEELGLSNFYHRHIHPLAFALTRAQNRGVLFDEAKRKKLKAEFESKTVALQTEIDKEVGKAINIRSPKQLQAFLYEQLNLPRIYNEEGKETADDEAITKLIKKCPEVGILRKIRELKQTQTICSLTLEIETGADGRVRTSFNLSGTDTGRISSSIPTDRNPEKPGARTTIIKQRGLNLQNVPKHTEASKTIRSLFIAGTGNVLVKGDLSQAEARIVGERLRLCGNPLLSNLFKNSESSSSGKKFDIHRWHAANNIFHKPESDITTDERFVAKTAIHSGNYGAGPRILVSRALKQDPNSNIDFYIAKRALEAHRQVFGLEVWWREVERKLTSSRMLTNCFGRKRFFFGRLDDETFRAGYGFEPQSTIADLTGEIFIHLDELLPDGAYCLLHVHDEVVIEAKNDYATLSAVVSLLRRVAKYPIILDIQPEIYPFDGEYKWTKVEGHEECFVPIDIEIGQNWKDTEPADQYLSKLVP